MARFVCALWRRSCDMSSCGVDETKARRMLDFRMVLRLQSDDCVRLFVVRSPFVYASVSHE